MQAVCALVGVILLLLAGLNVAGPRFSPGWLGLGFCALAVFAVQILGLLNG